MQVFKYVPTNSFVCATAQDGDILAVKRWGADHIAKGAYYEQGAGQTLWRSKELPHEKAMSPAVFARKALPSAYHA